MSNNYKLDKNKFMALFSERYGYIKPSNIIIRESITEEIQNAIYNWLYEISTELDSDSYALMEEYVWKYFLNKKKSDFWGSDRFGRHDTYKLASLNFIESKDNPWYRKLDLLEFIIEYCFKEFNHNFVSFFIENLNKEFERLNFAYRIVERRIGEVTSELEIAEIEKAINTQDNLIRKHLQKALELYAKRPKGDYQNSIKESITAVEVFCRKITGENTLGRALSKLEALHPILKTAFEKLYVYTNDSKTGIRHGMMDSTETYTPSADEAILMLVLCSSFVNYLNKKRIK